jgi:hypothetical protein
VKGDGEGFIFIPMAGASLAWMVEDQGFEAQNRNPH